MTLERSAAETQWESEHFLVSRTSLQPAPRSHYDVTVRKVLAGNGIDRNVMLEQLRAKEDRSEAVDLVVVGGGITGAGVALDAALRGFDVVLVERGDLPLVRRQKARSSCTVACDTFNRVMWR